MHLSPARYQGQESHYHLSSFPFLQYLVESITHSRFIVNIAECMTKAYFTTHCGVQPVKIIITNTFGALTKC